MTTKIFVIALFSLFALTVKAQWSAQNSGTLQHLNSCYFISTNQGWAIGDSGTILNTNNGGVQWTQQVTNTFNHLQSVFFASSSLGWVCGEAGTILNTTDGGNTWSNQNSNVSNYLKSIFFISPTKGWVVGFNGIILTTNDGGITWVQQTSGTSNHLYSVHFTSSMEGWAVGYYPTNSILITNDGGNTWTAQNSGIFYGSTSIHFISSNQGCIAGNDGVLTTNNKGVTWTQNTTPFAFQYLNSVVFTSINIGWIVGGRNGGGATIHKTIDGGTTWATQKIDSIIQLYSIYFASVSHGWTVGTFGTILHTSNGGGTVSIQEKWQPNLIGSEVFPNPMSEVSNIKYEVQGTKPVQLSLFDITGKEIQTLVNETKTAGEYNVPLHKNNLTNGMYFYRLQIGENVETKKIIIQ